MVNKVAPHIEVSKVAKDNFKQLSSGRVSETAVKVSQDSVASLERGKNQDRVSRLLRDLSDAVRHSARALNSLSKIGETSEEASSLESLDDLEHARENIEEAVGVLKNKLDAAEVVNENFSSASSELQDIKTASLQAYETNQHIQEEQDQAIDAHGYLSAEQVEDLLKE